LVAHAVSRLFGLDRFLPSHAKAMNDALKLYATLGRALIEARTQNGASATWTTRLLRSSV
jgi:hypothetical protein